MDHQLLQNGNSNSTNGLDLTLRLGLPVNHNEYYEWAAEAAARDEHYNGFIYVGPYTPNQTIVNPFEILNNARSSTSVNRPPANNGVPRVFPRKILTATVRYGPIRPGGEAELYWGYVTKSYLTIHLPAPTATATPQTRTYVCHPDQRCSNLSCGRTLTSNWLQGPFGPKTLCNCCGIEFRKIRDSIASFVARRMDEILAASTINIQIPDNL